MDMIARKYAFDSPCLVFTDTLPDGRTLSVVLESRATDESGDVARVTLQAAERLELMARLMRQTNAEMFDPVQKLNATGGDT